MMEDYETTSRLLFAMELGVDKAMQGETTGNGLTTKQQLALELFPRAVGLITLISSIAMITIAWKRRKYLFHRLVLGMSFYQLLYGILYFVGTLPIPRELDGYVLNYGTWGTCTAQGFLLYIASRVSGLYYACFCIYSYVGVLSGFDLNKYKWTEKWIHGIPHVYAFVTGVTFLVQQDYNPYYGYCKVGSYPVGCEMTEDVECERGPDHLSETKFFFMWWLPVPIAGVLMSTVMIALYFKVRAREAQEDAGRKVIIKSRSVAMQSCVYMFFVVWTVLPWFLLVAVIYYTKYTFLDLFPWVVAAKLNFGLFGLWNMLWYMHFTIDPFKSKRKKDSKVVKIADKPHEGEFIFKTGASSSKLEDSNSTDSPTNKTAGQAHQRESEGTAESAEAPEQRFEFNIFDGTNASGMYADFIHEGDSEDERMDCEETERWNCIQNHI